MTVEILVGDVFARLADLPDESVDCVVTSPPYWGLRDYGVEGQLGLERTLGEHLEKMVAVFEEVRRVLKPEGTVWVNYGDCYATTPNGRSAADTKAAGTDDRTFRDKPFSTVGPICVPDPRNDDRRGTKSTLQGSKPHHTPARIVAGGYLKPKDLCMVPNRFAIAMQDAGWWVRSEIVWGKPNPMPDSSGRWRPSTAHEKIFLFTKSAKSYYDKKAVMYPATESSIKRLSQNVDAQEGSSRANGGRKSNGKMKAVGGARTKRAIPPGSRGEVHHEKLSNYPRGEGRLLRNYESDLSPIVPPEVWEIPTASFAEAHFATFPPALVAPCILSGCPKGGMVLDPFGGAGTTGLVADRLGRSAILIELNPEYADLARNRLRRLLTAVKVDREEPPQEIGGLFSFGGGK